MAELRQNAVTGRWVAVAPGRGRRPVEHSEHSVRAEPGGEGEVERDPDCPFCPGNEKELPSILWELASDDAPGWRCRAVPNRYAAFSPEAGSGAGKEPEPRAPSVLAEHEDTVPDPGRSHPAEGLQEVLIESPRHGHGPADMSPTELEAVVELYARSLGRLARHHPGLTPCLFRNEGAGAGASLRHPHAQLIATSAVPPATARREARQHRYRDGAGGCLLCELPALEPDATERTVLDDEHFRVEVPWAPERPLEVWLVPRRHRAAVHEMGDDEAAALARILGRVLRGLRILSGDADYNYILHSTSGARASDPALHWFLQIRPVTAKMAGFELGSGVRINPADPTDDARRLRDVLEDAGDEETTKRGDSA